MVTLIRVEAEGPALNNVVRDLDQIASEINPLLMLNVHDEHYERVHDTLFKGRRVYRIGEKATGGTVIAFDSTSSATYTTT